VSRSGWSSVIPATAYTKRKRVEESLCRFAPCVAVVQIRRRYRATLRSDTTKPSFCRSPWIFGLPSPDSLLPAPDQTVDFITACRPEVQRALRCQLRIPIFLQENIYVILSFGRNTKNLVP
jgi:hypothetical protein